MRHGCFPTRYRAVYNTENTVFWAINFCLEFWVMNTKMRETPYISRKSKRKQKHEESIYRIVPLFFEVCFQNENLISDLLHDTSWRHMASTSLCFALPVAIARCPSQQQLLKVTAGLQSLIPSWVSLDKNSSEFASLSCFATACMQNCCILLDHAQQH